MGRTGRILSEVEKNGHLTYRGMKEYLDGLIRAYDMKIEEIENER